MGGHVSVAAGGPLQRPDASGPRNFTVCVAPAGEAIWEQEVSGQDANNRTAPREWTAFHVGGALPTVFVVGPLSPLARATETDCHTPTLQALCGRGVPCRLSAVGRRARRNRDG